MKRLLLLLALAFPAFAARTTVTGTLQLANGSFCSGTLSISNPPFTNSDGFFAGGSFTTPINAATGTFSVSLEPGPYYTVTYVTAPSGCAPPTEFWSVPVSATPVDVSSVRSVAPPPPLPNTIPLSYITQSGATTGQFAKWDGNTWVPATGSGGGTIPSTTSALRGDGAGNALAVTGTGSNCVHVDGTSAACSSGSGTVTVVGAGTLMSSALVTGGGAQAIQTPSSTATLSAGGDLSTPGTISAGVGGTAAGAIELTQGTAYSLGTTSVGIYAPTSVTSYAFLLPSAAGTGFMLGTNAANVDTLSFVGFTGTGNVVRDTTPTLITPVIGAATGTSLVLTGGVTSGSGTGVAGVIDLTQGTLPASFPANSFSLYAPTSIGTSYQWKVPAADAAGGIVSDGAGALSIKGFSGTGNFCLASGSACSGSGGGFTLIEEHTASGSASLDFSACISSTYNNYYFIFENILPATDAANLYWRASTNGGMSYDSGANYAWTTYGFIPGAAGAPPGANSGATFARIADGLSNASTGGLTGELILGNPLSAANWKRITGMLGYTASTNRIVGIPSSSAYQSATAVNAVQFFMSTGNVASGTIYCYGLSK